MARKPKKKLTAAQRREKKRRKEEFQTIFINGKQKRVRRAPTIDGMDADEFIQRNADPIWLHQNEMWERIPRVDRPRVGAIAAGSKSPHRRAHSRSAGTVLPLGHRSGPFFQRPQTREIRRRPLETLVPYFLEGTDRRKTHSRSRISGLNFFAGNPGHDLQMERPGCPA